MLLKRKLRNIVKHSHLSWFAHCGLMSPNGDIPRSGSTLVQLMSCWRQASLFVGWSSWVRCCGIPWWRHQMETFSALLAICAANSPHKGQWRGSLMFSLMCAWINGWVNNGEATDLRHHRAHYDVIVMISREMLTISVPGVNITNSLLQPHLVSQIAKFMGPMLAPWTLLSR